MSGAVTQVTLSTSIPAIEWAPQQQQDGDLGLSRCLGGFSQ
jgi:hypothetical protein